MKRGEVFQLHHKKKTSCKASRTKIADLSANPFDSPTNAFARFIGNNGNEKLVVEVQSILFYLDCDIHFSYVSGHSGNLGNHTADQLAKEATFQDVNLLMSVPLSHWKHLAWERTASSWNTEFLASPKVLWTKKVFPTVYQRLKCKSFVTDFKLSQILTGHGNFNIYLSRFNLIASDIFSCGQDAETVEHVLLYCKLYFCKRENFRNELKHV
ncbi:RNase H domain-containing protein [Trichonephila clavipes]|nr:RNase H domain-containing protein [Trichonephila clavipes]